VWQPRDVQGKQGETKALPAMDDLTERLKTRLKRAAGTRSDYDLSPDLRAEAPTVLKPAAVLVPIVTRAPEPMLLLTRRADHLAAHAGQVGFPGGRIEPGDASPVAAALREAREEIGLEPEFVTAIGRLDDYETGTGFRITPVVGLLRPGFTLRLAAREVADAFEVPLSFLMEPKNHARHRAVWRGKEREFYALPYDGHYIWGATAGMIVNLYQKLYGP
jgi:8-oxo-dGTP pyrophosphatase MutT (NUDIX family)